jgi:hypothetical protein
LALAIAPGSEVLAQASEHAAAATTEGLLASGHASASAAHGVVASGQVTSAVAAVPLSVGAAALGSAAAATSAAAAGAAHAATVRIGAPLPVTEETIVTIPPDVALKSKSAAGGKAETPAAATDKK